mmetsp:Transcript_18747/g.44505  ORF Transcript_18747/g.44505 Transcript_18747/m.44505 type:complete len:211 (-) Transcript_18747:89-721(-)
MDGGDHRDLLAVVARQSDGLHVLHDDLRHHTIEPRGGLIAVEHRGLRQDLRGEAHAPLFVLGDAAVDVPYEAVLALLEPQHLNGGLHPQLPRLCPHAAGHPQLALEEQVLSRCVALQEHFLLVDIGHLALHRLRELHGVEGQGAAGGRGAHRQAVQQGGLPGPRGAHDGQQLPRQREAADFREDLLVFQLLALLDPGDQVQVIPIHTHRF